MNAELRQSVVSAAGQKVSAGTASGGTLAAGLGTYFEILPALLGSLASMVGIFVSTGLFYLAWKKNRLERKQLHLQIAVLEAKAEARTP